MSVIRRRAVWGRTAAGRARAVRVHPSDTTAKAVVKHIRRRRRGGTSVQLLSKRLVKVVHPGHGHFFRPPPRHASRACHNGTSPRRLSFNLGLDRECGSPHPVLPVPDHVRHLVVGEVVLVERRNAEVGHFGVDGDGHLGGECIRCQYNDGQDGVAEFGHGVDMFNKSTCWSGLEFVGRRWMCSLSKVK